MSMRHFDERLAGWIAQPHTKRIEAEQTRSVIEGRWPILLNPAKVVSLLTISRSKGNGAHQSAGSDHPNTDESLAQRNVVEATALWSSCPAGHGLSAVSFSFYKGLSLTGGQRFSYSSQRSSGPAPVF